MRPRPTSRLQVLFRRLIADILAWNPKRRIADRTAVLSATGPIESLEARALLTNGMTNPSAAVDDDAGIAIDDAKSVKIASDLNGGPSLQNGDNFGRSVASLGDLDGDGVTDLAVGAYYDFTGGSYRGAAYVLLMNTNGTVKRSVKLASDTNGVPTLNDNDEFGSSVAGLGDVNGDGVPDLAVGAERDDTGFQDGDQGAVYVLLMNNDGTVKDNVKIASQTNGGTKLGIGDHFGSALNSHGDLDGDGIPDLIVGAENDDATSPYSQRGAVHILLLNSDGTARSDVKIDDSTVDGPILFDFDHFGCAVALLGDVDGDGVQDLAVGAEHDGTGGTARGAVHVLFLDSDGAVKSTTTIVSGGTGGTSFTDNAYFGSSVAGVGDLDGDGVPDLAVGARGDGGGTFRGAVHVLLLNSDGTVKSGTEFSNGLNGCPTISDSDRFGNSVTSLGDLDGDGITDLAVGASAEGTGGYGRGAVHILFLKGSGAVGITPPVITLDPQPLSYRVSAKKVVAIDPAATITVTDNAILDFTNAVLQVSGAAAKDTLSIIKQGHIKLKSKSILFDKTVIGTFSGGTKAKPLMITLKGGATLEHIQALLRNLGFKSTDKQAKSRSLQIQITKIDGTDTNPAPRLIQFA